ncbi:RIP metalloprotease RseP [Xanthovirga aplysinae]|uniref:RIP metalloprotease RseP n=1 Tax=Xanthovirga aplysinae TaxID=2529853 RepID=UPI0012BD4032|nr:RIP metalloprotease RseP [Xanthovirga aplysinae]MTI30167.1 RIP metalloprotease RseP [Xanthovirga aplysinae]
MESLLEGLVMAAQLILALSILVGVHEFGHLIAARLFGMRVEQYSIGFPPKIFGFKVGQTEYSLGAIPLGGFVKISGMIDESLDTEGLSEEPKPWEFRSKPAWQRLIVMMGGIIVNVITGILIFVFMTYVNGVSYFPKEEVNKNGIMAYELAQEIGLKTGDKIIKLNGHDYENFSDLRSAEAIFADNGYYTVERNGEIIDIPIPGDLVEKLSEKNVKFIEPLFPFNVNQVAPGSGADKGGLKAGDQILSIAGEPVSFFQELKPILEQYKGQTIDVNVLRDGSSLTLPIKVDVDATLGFSSEMLLASKHQDYTFMQAIPEGVDMAFETVWANAKGLGKIFSGEVSASKSISSPIGIAQMYGGTWDWNRFWYLTGVISMILAFMNFLPIPALDGGHVMFLTYEMISGRAPSDKFLEVAQKAGMVILLSIMVFAIGNDLFKNLF